MVVFTVSSSVVSEGDIVEVQWSATDASQVVLRIDNGYKKTELVLPSNEGNKRFRLHRSKGRTTLTLITTINGHTACEKRYVRVRPIPTSRTETVDDQGNKIGFFAKWSAKLSKWVRDNSLRFRMGYQSLPPHKKPLVMVLMILLGLQILGIIFPGLLRYTFLILTVLLLWRILKK